MGDKRPHITISTIKSIVDKEIYNLNIAPKNMSLIREGYLVWEKRDTDADGNRYWWYRDGKEVINLGSPEKVPFKWYLYPELKPGDIVGPSVPPNPATDPPMDEWMPKVWSPGGTCPDGSIPVPADKTVNDKEYMLYMQDSTLFIRHWEPCAPLGPAYITELPKASVLSAKVEIVAASETFPPPGPDNTSISYQKWAPALRTIIVDTNLTVHSSVRFNAHILRPAVSLAEVGVNGEYQYQNDTPISGNSTVTFARDLQVGDYIVLTF